MTVAFYSFINPIGKKGSRRCYIADDEDEIDFLDRVRIDLANMISVGYLILCVEVT